MSIIRHTPGPWTAEEMTHLGEPGTGFWHVNPVGEPDDTLTEADARLIAAAPDLLEAAKAVRDCDVYSPNSIGTLAVFDLIYAAIAKAEGRSVCP